MPKQPRFTFTLDPRLNEPLRIQADREFRSMASLVNELIARYLQEQGFDIENNNYRDKTDR